MCFGTPFHPVTPKALRRRRPQQDRVREKKRISCRADICHRLLAIPGRVAPFAPRLLEGAGL